MKNKIRNMKILYRYTKKLFWLLLISVSFYACKKDILDETPLDFLSPENSYTTPAGIESAFFPMYARLVYLFNGLQNQGAYRHYGTDLMYDGRNRAVASFGDYKLLDENNAIARNSWIVYYEMIKNANVILSRIGKVPYPTELARTRNIAEARFFRGYAYKALGNQFGGVPILLDEITAPKKDFVRSTRLETYNQAIEDMLFAANNLPGIAEVKVEGRVNSAVANHFLAELYVTVKKWDEAIAAASKVISDPAVSIMTARFGKKAGQVGDPYWDLFQKGNQTRTVGNREGLLVLQEAFNIPGGTDPDIFNPSGFLFERVYAPLFWQLTDEDKVPLFNNKPYTSIGGLPAGRGVALAHPTEYFSYTIWEGPSGKVDLRNNNRNLTRDWIVINPASKYFGRMASEAKTAFVAQDTFLRWFPYIAKATTVGDHPALIVANAVTGELTSNGGKTYKDWYMVRVAETYLLRAEAKLGKLDISGAADDINVVRRRSNAIPVSPADVNINYILDERLRELNIEEDRRSTLARLDMLYDRVRLGNVYSGKTIQPYNNLYPIPFTEIERNTGAKLEQNPGYN